MPLRISASPRLREAQSPVRPTVAKFANANGYAVRFTQTTPDPKDLVDYLDSEGLNITIDKAFLNTQTDVHVYRAGDRTTSMAAIDGTFDLLRQAIERVPSVTFTPRT